MDADGFSNSFPTWVPYDQQPHGMLPIPDQQDCYMMTSEPLYDRGDNEVAPTSSEWSVPSGSVELASPSKSHSQAEKRRRDRINAQLARLRNLIPRSDKMDKAALLGSSVDHVKELKRKALEVSDGVTVPSEIDEVLIEECFGSPGQTPMIKSTLCCEDRPDLFKDVIKTLKGLKLMAIGADMACLGGRVKIILILSATEGDQIDIGALKQPLKAALSRIASFCNTSSSGFRLTSRRQRMMFPS